MPKYIAIVHYENDEAFEKHDANIQTTVNNKFTEMGATKIEKMPSSIPTFPPTYTFAVEVPDYVSEDDLKMVDLGDDVSKDFLEA